MRSEHKEEFTGNFPDWHNKPVGGFPGGKYNAKNSLPQVLACILKNYMVSGSL
jgi:hypothetical protein